MRHVLFVSIFILAATAALAQPPSFLSCLSRDSVIDVRLSIDRSTLVKKKKDKQYLQAHVTTNLSDKGETQIPVKVRTRGNMRLNICSQPPLKLKFDKSILTGLSLTHHNELDLVNPCHPGGAYEQLVLKEYLAYRLYQLISPVSYRVQLIRLRFEDPSDGKCSDPVYAFFIEDTEELVDRLGAKRHTSEWLSQNAVDKTTFLTVCLFQYMIGNTDWFVRNRHNLEFIILPGYSLLVPVPFDFDYSGLVSAPYASHHESIGLPAVTMRYYQGRCAAEEDVAKAVENFKSKKDQMLDLCGRIPGLDERSVKHIQDYLLEFFAIIEHPKKLESHILRHCDKWPAEN